MTAVDGRLDVTLTASESEIPYGSGTRWAMTYNGQATGPTLRIHPGDHLTITLINDLDEPTSLHTHGLHVSPEQDNPFVMVDPGTSRTFEYDVPRDQQAGTFWYHPHVHEFTAEQVAAGLSGAILVEDATDAELARVSADHVLVINDPPLDARRSGPIGPHMGGMPMDGMNHGSGMNMMTTMMGRSGPRLLTNGHDGMELNGDPGSLQRAHIVNASASTSLRLGYSGAQMLQLATSGGRFPTPEAVDALTLAPGERAEVVLLPGPDGGELTAERIRSERSGSYAGRTEVIASVPQDAGRDPGALPSTLNPPTRDLFAPDVQIAKRRIITLDGHMRPTIDGQPFNPDVVNLRARKDTVEEWVMENNTPMMHPIHLHTWPFQIQGQQGWQDVVPVPAYQRRVIRVAFDDFGGKTVLHCHILDHEDIGMMAVIEVS